MDKFTIIVRADIDPGLQLAQACHAVAAFSQQHPESFSLWVREVKNIAVLAIPNLQALLDLYELAARKGIARAIFIEPDLGDEATAIALGEGAHKICSHLPKALRPPRAKSDMAAE
jgi:peptidyl-tRNA hydrolase